MEETKEAQKEPAQTEQVQVQAQEVQQQENKYQQYDFKTNLGKRVKAGEIKNIDEVLRTNVKILEDRIVDYLMPNLQTGFLFIGQSKGKLGGGKRRIIRNTQKVTAEGKRQRFSAMAVVGDENGHIGIGKGSGLESVIAKEKAVKKAKLNLIHIKIGCGSWECACKTQHSIPFKVTGKSGSVIVTLMPAPKGIGFAAADDIKTILKLAGLKDVWSKVEGHTGTRINLGYATFKALKALNLYRYSENERSSLGLEA